MLQNILERTEYTHNTNYMAQNANSAEVETLCYKSNKFSEECMIQMYKKKKKN